MEILNANGRQNRITNGATEFTMQEQIHEFLYNYEFNKETSQYPFYKVLPKIVLRELRIPEINRISDHVILLDNKRTVNIEDKLDSIECVIAQAKDHLQWCDYSVICVPPDRTYIPTKYIKQIIDLGIGMFYWFNNIGVFEFIVPRYNKLKDAELRKKIITRILNNAEGKNISKYIIDKQNLFEKVADEQI
jgi:hypothetical protein